MINSIPTEFENLDLSVVVDKATILLLRAPIKAPVKTSFGTMTDRPAIYLLLQDTQGHVGVGEVWCNFPSCGAEHRERLLESAILPALIGKEFSDPTQCFHTLQKHFKRLAIQSGEHGPIAQSIAGIDGALWDLVAKRLELPLHKLLGAEHSTIGVYASGINPTGAAEAVARCRDAGYTGFKLKIGFGEKIDYPNIENICAQLGATEKLMVDANQAWTLDEAAIHVGRLADYPIEWLEEPIMADSPDTDWETLAQTSAIPLAAGENIADTHSFSVANASSWLSVMQPDMCKWGGFSGVVPVSREALKQGKRLCPHFLGGGVGLAASAQLLATVGGTGLLEIDFNPNPLRERLFAPSVESGRIVLSEEPGIGVDLQALRKLQNDPVLSANPAQLSR